MNQSVFHLFHKYLLNVYYMLGTNLCLSDRLMDNPNYMVSVFEEWPPVSAIYFYVAN